MDKMSSTPQHPLPLSSGFEKSHAQPKIIVGTAGGSTQLDPKDRFVIVTPPASGVHTIIAPKYSEWQNDDLSIYSNGAAGGSVTLEDQNGTDLIGDNLTASGDHAVVRNWWGRYTAVIKDVTT